MRQSYEIAGFWRQVRVPFAGAALSAAKLRAWWVLFFLALATAAFAVEARTPLGYDDAADSTITMGELPIEAREVLRLIEQGGPFPYAKDGSVFGNREHRLPSRPHGYYREYTVPTLGSRDRGPRRIIAGRDGERYYTGDHYRRLKRIE